MPDRNSDLERRLAVVSKQLEESANELSAQVERLRELFKKNPPEEEPDE